MSVKPYSRLALANNFLKFYAKAQNSKGHGVHSPFVFDFILNVLNNRRGYQAPAALELVRKEWSNDQSPIDQIDLGAGSRKGRKGRQTVAAIAKTSLKPPKLAVMLHRLVRHYQPQDILELGTCLGLTTAYMATAKPAARITTIEGNPDVARQARSLFQKLGLTQIHSVEGSFDEVLPGILEQRGRVGLAYIDGNHREEPTLSYFRMMLPYCDEHSILVFDDIHWSAGMESAWEQIINHPSVKYSIDIFHMGFVFFRSEFREPQKFSIRFL